MGMGNKLRLRTTGNRVSGMLTVEATLVMGISLIILFEFIGLGLKVYKREITEAKLYIIYEKAAYEQWSEDRLNEKLDEADAEDAETRISVEAVLPGQFIRMTEAAKEVFTEN